MRIVALVILNTETGTMIRYQSDHGCHVRETGRASFEGWDPLDSSVDWDAVARHIEAFRAAYVEPEPLPPRPTAPMRDQRELLAA